MSSQQDVIKKFMKSLDTTNLRGVNAVDEAVRACSNFNSISKVISQMVSDCRNASSADDFLKNYCGIDLDNLDTGAITGYDAGGSTVKTAESIVPEVGGFNTYFSDTSFTANGVTFDLVKYNDDYSYYSISFDSLSDVQKLMWRGLYTWWGENSLSLISESYGSNFGFDSYSSATAKTIHFGFIENDSDTLAWTVPYYYTSDTYYKTAVDLGFAINMDFYSNLSTTDVNGYDPVSGQTYLDRVLAHEFTHAVMMANINYFNDLPTIFVEGMAEVTHGIDDQRTGGIRTLAGSSDLLSQALDLDTGYHAIEGVHAPDYVGGYMLLRYLAKQVADGNDDDGGDGGEDNTDFEFTQGADFYDDSISDTILSALGGNDTVYSNGDNVTIDGGKGNDYIWSWGTNISMNGGVGSDTLGTYGNYVTLTGGAGNDSIGVNTAATNLKIYGGAGKDSINNWGSTGKIYGGTGNDWIFNNGSKITIYGGAGNDTLQGHEKADRLYGEAGNDSLVGGAGNDYLNGGSGNDTLIGGTGKDTLYGGTGKDVFVYGSGDGNDIILDYVAGVDKIKISSGSISKTSYSGKNVIFKIGSGTLTVKNGKGKKITIEDANGKTTTKVYKATSYAEEIFLNSDEETVQSDSQNTPPVAEPFAENVSDTWFTENENNFTNNTNDLEKIMGTPLIQPPPKMMPTENITNLENISPTLTYAELKNNFNSATI